MEYVIAALGHADVTVEFVRQQQRTSGHGHGSSAQAAHADLVATMGRSRRIVRIVDGPYAGLEVEDLSRSLSAPGTRLVATVRRIGDTPASCG
jgi:hypothetical protein